MSMYNNNYEKDMYYGKNGNGKDNYGGKDSYGGKECYSGKEYYGNECYSDKKEKYEYENCDCKFAQHIKKYIGETVTVFTASGGATGCGFTGFLIDVNCCFIRIISKQGSEPACPLGSSCCCDHDGMEKGKSYYCTVGAVSDIPIDKIVAFTHNAV